MRVALLLVAVVGTSGLGIAIQGCGSKSSGGAGVGVVSSQSPPGSGVAWPSDYAAVFGASYMDAVNDLTIDHPGAAPSYLLPFPSIDVSQVRLGIEGDFLYVRVDYAGPIPTAPVAIAASGEIEAQVVHGQSQSLVIDADGDDQTGAGASPWLEGVDLFFAINFQYGIESLIYANYDYEQGDIHLHRGQVLGEVGEGGPGFSYVIVRYDVSQLSAAFFPRGQTIEIGSWTEAESELYHELAVDSVLDHETWDVPD